MPWAATEAEAYRADDRQVMDSGQPKLHVIESQRRVDGSLDEHKGWTESVARGIVALYFATGLRPSELREGYFEDLSLRKGT